MSTTRAVWFFLLALTALRLANLASTELSPDEAHYWMWSERPALSYFSKGPGVAFAIRASTAIFGANEFGVRFWSPLLALGTSLLMFDLAQRFFSATAAFWTVIALNVTPIFNIGTSVMTIDPLSIFFWTAALLSFWLALERSPRFSLHWPLTGLLIGLGFLCKYTNAMQLVSVLVILALNPRLRVEFRRPGLYLLLAVFAVCTLPPVIWNAQRDWITLDHLRARGSLDEAPGFHPGELLAFIGEHFLVYSPLLFLGLAWSAIASWRRAEHHFKVLYLLWFGLPLIAFYALLSINKTAAPNWTAPAFISLGVLAVSYWRERIASQPRMTTWAAAAILLALLMSVVALNSGLLQSAGLRLPRRDPSDRLRGWKLLAQTVEKMRGDLEARLGERVFLIADERDRASEISFYLREKRVEGPGHPPVYITESQDIRNQFSFWPRYDQFEETPGRERAKEGDVYTEENGVNRFLGRSALYVQSRKDEEAPRNIRRAFARVESLGTISVRRYGEPLRDVQVFACYNYQTLPL